MKFTWLHVLLLTAAASVLTLTAHAQGVCNYCANAGNGCYVCADPPIYYEGVMGRCFATTCHCQGRLCYNTCAVQSPFCYPVGGPVKQADVVAQMDNKPQPLPKELAAPGSKLKALRITCPKNGNFIEYTRLAWTLYDKKHNVIAVGPIATAPAMVLEPKMLLRHSDGTVEPELQAPTEK